MFITGVNDTANDLLTDVNDTGDETVSTISACLHLRYTVTLGKNQYMSLNWNPTASQLKGGSHCWCGSW
jgi:hypothetical protein